MADQPAAGWYPDPNTPGQRRYWDGSKWTEHTDKQQQQAQPAQQAQQQQAQPQQARQQAPAAPQVPARPQAPQGPARPQAPAVQQPQAAAARPGGFAPQGGAVASKPGHPGIGIAGFVCGLVGLILSLTIICWFIGLPLAIIGTVLGGLGLRQANEQGAPKGLSMAGLICGIVGIVAGVIITVAVALA